MKFLFAFFLLSFSWIQLCLGVSTSVPAPSAAAQEMLNGIPLLAEPYDLTTNSSLNEYSNYYTFRQVNVDSLPDGKLAEFIPILDDPSGKLVIEIKMTKTGARNPAVLMETYMRLKQVAHAGHGLSGAYHWIQTLNDAEAGSLMARETLARLEAESLPWTVSSLEARVLGENVSVDNPKIKEYLELRTTESVARHREIKRLADADLRERRRAQEALRPTFTSLEKAQLKLDDLILRNDRQGVRTMLDAYLPWKLMEPTESRMWKDWLDAMVNPDPARMKVVFRGMDDYPTLKGANGERGVLSSVLAMNQGNYTRRLRSLTTLRERLGSAEYYPNTNDYTKAARGNPNILTTMSGHAGDPRGSPFISVSDNQTARSFGSYDRMALKIDERRLVPNLMAYGFDENERLVSLVIFPDEIVYHHERVKGTYTAIDEADFQAKTEARLGRPLTPEELHWQISQEDYNKWSFAQTKEQFLTPPPASIVGSNCAADAARILDRLLAD